MYKYFFIIYVFTAFSVYSDEIVNSIKYNGLAPIAINGDLSDWDTVDIPKCSIENPIAEKPKSNNDISAYFKIVSDNNNYYYGINVSDDIVTIDNPNYKYLYDKDCVEILINNNLFNSNPIKIWISRDNTGKALVDGRNTVGYSYPYIWHSYGVVAAIQQTKQGYCVEVLIPKEMLSYFGNTSSDFFTNLNVYDYDKDGIPKKVLQWKSGIQKNNFGRIVFDKTIDMIRDNSFNNNLVLNIESMSNSTPETSLAIAKAYQRAGKYKESNEILRKALDNSNGKDKDIVKSEMIYNFYKLNDLKNVYALYNEIINNNGEVTPTVFNILYTIEIKKYEYLSDVFPVTEENYKSRSIINLHWGTNVDQIAYIENVYNGIDGGPSSFDIDNQGNIYIVDGGNEAVKIYNYNGKLVRTFPIAANYYPTLFLSLGINNEIWIHESDTKCFSCIFRPWIFAKNN